MNNKELVCKHCGIFMNTNELKDGNCDVCDSDEGLFVNDGDED